MQRSILIVLGLVVAALLGWFASFDGRTTRQRHAQRVLPVDFDGPLVLEGQVQLDPGVPDDVLTLRLVYPEERGSPQLRDSVGPGGKFAIEGLLPGKARLEIHAPGGVAPLEVLEDLELPSDRPVAFDLRGRLSLTEIQVSGPQGDPVAEALVAWRPSGEGTFDHYGMAIDGELTLATAVEPIDLYVQSEGARSRLVRGVIGWTSVELRSGIPALLGLPEGIDPQADRVQLLGSVVRGDPPTVLEGSVRPVVNYLRLVDRVDLSGGEPVPIEVPSSGSYRVEWRMFDTADDHFLPFPGSPAPSTFEIRASSPGESVVPPFPQALYRAALEQ